jgi:hypothetical protein
MGERVKRDIQTIILEETLAGKRPTQILERIRRQRPDINLTYRALRNYQYRLRSVGALPATSRSRLLNKSIRSTRSIRAIIIEATLKGASPKEALAAVKKERPDAKTTVRSVYVIRRDIRLSGETLPFGAGKPQKNSRKSASAS